MLIVMKKIIVCLFVFSFIQNNGYSHNTIKNKDSKKRD